MMQIMAIIEAVKGWVRRSNERHCLAYLSEWQLRDIGLDPHRAQMEANKPFWRA